MRTIYKPSSQLYVDYYKQQGSGLPYFQGRQYQQGFGIGNILGGLFRSVMPLIKKTAVPLIKKGAKILGREALSTGSNILKGMVETRGKVPIKKIVAREAKKGLKRAAGRIVHGRGLSRKRIKRIRHCAAKHTKPGDILS